MASLLGVVDCDRVLFLKHDPGLVESRLKTCPTAEHEKSQKIIQTLTAILWCALIIVPGTERHFHSSRIPAPLVVLGNALVAVGYYIVFLALRENRWAASIIEVQPGQRVISTGPYGIVRHPMYSGGVLMILATPLALGSLWAFVCAVLLCGVIAARLLDEDADPLCARSGQAMAPITPMCHGEFSLRNSKNGRPEENIRACTQPGLAQ